jgi:hypothetical protein
MSREDITPRNERERRALEEIAEMDNDPKHPSNDAGHPGHQAAIDRKQALWRIVLADRNEKLWTVREPGDPPVVTGR